MYLYVARLLIDRKVYCSSLADCFLAIERKQIMRDNAFYQLSSDLRFALFCYTLFRVRLTVLS